ncbi:MAG: hypothetical protein L6Q95_02120 [Planctomycetes bacterium]|nr:hypothetical protein [Planctomycetota bacterium]
MVERIALLLLLASAARAQEPAPAEEDPNVLLSLAFRKLQTAEHVAASVDVKHEPPEEPAIGGQGGAGGMIIMETRVAGQEDPFEGRVDACRTADGTVVLLSEKDLPGFALYVGPERTVERTTFEEERFSLSELRAELTALLDAKALGQHVFDGKLAPVRDAATGEITFKGPVAREVVPAVEDPMAFTRGRVLKAEATVVVTPDGRVKSAAVKITRSDPLREMMRGEMRRVVIRGGAPPGALPPADDGRKHDIPGGSTTYTIAFRETPPSDRAKAFREEVERLLAVAARAGK